MSNVQNKKGPEVIRVDKKGTQLPPDVPFGVKSIKELTDEKNQNEASQFEQEMKARSKERTAHILTELEVIMRENEVSLEEATQIFKFFINFYNEKARFDYIFKHDAKSNRAKDELPKMRNKIKTYLRDLKDK